MTLDYVMNKNGTPGKEWNAITGCKEDLEICPIWGKCWARGFASRLQGRYGYDATDPFKPTFHEDKLYLPFKRKIPTAFYVGYMGDMWGDWCLSEEKKQWNRRVLRNILGTPQHRYLFLTKRPWNYTFFHIPMNAWIGTSIWNKKSLNNYPYLFENPNYKYIEIEPVILDISKELDVYITLYGKVDWAIIGGWSGKDNSHLHPNVKAITEVLQEHDIPIWHKSNLDPLAWIHDNPLWETPTKEGD